MADIQVNIGGYRSSRWGNYKRRMCVEECSVISINRLQDEISQVYENSNSISGISECRGSLVEKRYVYWRIIKNNERMSLELRFYAPSFQDEITQFTDLEKIKINHGGLRWYFLCPGEKNDSMCNYRGTKMYNPQFSSKYFCRKCHDLAYKSSLISGKIPKSLWKNDLHIILLRS